MHRRRLEIVDPCTKDWAGMKGTSLVRHCTACSKSVYNLSMLTKREAEAALKVRPASVCVRYHVDANDQVIFYPEPGLSQRRSPLNSLATALAVSALAACSQPTDAVTQAPPVEMSAPVAARSPLALEKPPTPAVVAAAPVDAGLAPAPLIKETNTDGCASSWDDAFRKRGRSDKHLRKVRVPNGGVKAPVEDFGDPLQGGISAAPDPDPLRLQHLELSKDPHASPSVADVVQGFGKAQPVIDATCKGPGLVFADTEFAGSTGRVTSVHVTGDVSAAVAGCVAKAVRLVKVPKFTSKVFKVKYPYKLKG
jgi:hypothetical protein